MLRHLNTVITKRGLKRMLRLVIVSSPFSLCNEDNRARVSRCPTERRPGAHASSKGQVLTKYILFATGKARDCTIPGKDYAWSFPAQIVRCIQKNASH